MDVIWLNDMTVIKEAFVTKADVLSDRVIDYDKIDEIDKKLGAGTGIAATNYGKEFKERKFLTLQSMKNFGFGGKTLEEMAAEEVRYLVDEFSRVVGQPTSVHQNFVHLATANVISSLVFGRRFDYYDKNFLNAVSGVRSFLHKRTTFITRIPLTKYLPHVKRMKRREENHIQNILDFIEAQIQSHEEDFDYNSPRHFIDLCLKQATLKDAGVSSIGTANIKTIIFGLFVAGTDTTAATLSWLLLYMIRFPDIQRRCQEELDRVLGSDRDASSATLQRDFPYTLATLMEVQRISCIAGVSVPHNAREETVVGGYRIPAGAFVLANISFLHNNEMNFVNARLFDPARWLDPVDPDKLVSNPNFIPFAFGKRRCLGENLAKAEYFIFGITLIKKFRFRAVDAGNLPPIQGDGLVYSPIPFQMVIEKRFT